MIVILLLIIILALIGWFCYMHWEARQVEIKQEEITISALPMAFDGLRIGFISDLHIDSDTDFQFFCQQFQRLHEYPLDLLLIGGDYSNDEQNFRRVLQVIDQAHPALGIITVRGNHEKYMSKEKFEAILDQTQIRTGFNHILYIKKGTDVLPILCLDDYELGEENLSINLDASTPDIICLAHQPKSIARLGQQDPQIGQQISFALCGHAHGGQVTFFGLWGIRTNRKHPSKPNQWVCLHGIRTMESNGMGQRWNIRFFARPQMHVLTLHAAQASNK